MRTQILLAVFYLAVPGVFSSAICDYARAPASKGPSTAYLDATLSCINELCVTGGTSRTCESFQLSVTQGQKDVPIAAGVCNINFESIINQCVATEHSEGGIVVHHGARYEIHRIEKDNHHPRGADKRGSTSTLKNKSKGSGSAVKPKSSSLGAKPQSSSISVKKGAPSATSKPSASSTTIKSSFPSSSIKPTSTPNKNETAPACQRKDSKKTKSNKSTPGKTVKTVTRDVLEKFLPYSLLPRNPPAVDKGKGKAIETECRPSDDYFKRAISANVDHYYFHNAEDLRESMLYLTAEKHVINVFNKMRIGGYLNVIAFSGANQKTFCIGEPGRNNPKQIAAKEAEAGNQCVITNGNYFVLPGKDPMTWEYKGPVINDLEKYKGFSIGFTTTDPTKAQTVELPKDYKDYYEKFEGTDGSHMWCGPNLAEDLDYFKLDKFCPPKKRPRAARGTVPVPTAQELMRKAYGDIPGSLAHATTKADRLVTVIMSDEYKYIFSYTSPEKKQVGLDLQQMKDLIDTFLKGFTEAKKDGIKGAKQALNMDGGGSVYVVLVKANGEQEVIAAGKMDAEKEAENGGSLNKQRARTVQTIVKHTFMKRRITWEFGF
ncbi:hypothetical protein DM02DRAFT_663162 [Periconia macrospinosa]|uniref:Uncharacterized protein n=1 Tax=Periconia macrospinosa TaxID=97972 RepID=A0A2V1D2F3_9PLEO|nr:hypothetical protein DM02DRAFT_663162 [Periconia macrospinosa]